MPTSPYLLFLSFDYLLLSLSLLYFFAPATLQVGCLRTTSNS